MHSRTPFNFLSLLSSFLLGIKKQEQLLAFQQEAMLEKESWKCCMFPGTILRKEMSLSGRWDNMPPVNALKTSTYFPLSDR